MKKFTPKAALLSAGALVALCALAATNATIARAGDDAETTVALPAPTIINAINAAVAAKPGDIKSVETEVENGVNQIEIDLVATDDGKPYEVTVDATTAKVLDVKADTSEVPETEAPETEAPAPEAPAMGEPAPDAAPVDNPDIAE